MGLYDTIFLFIRENIFTSPEETLLETYEVMNIEGYGSLYFGDWLSHCATIICMCLIVAFAIWLVCWVFKAVAHAFLLRR